MKAFYFIIFIFLAFGACNPGNESEQKNLYGSGFEISKSQLENKIKGGWAGQTIGVTYGGPTEFNFNGTIINDYTPILWDDDQLLWWYENRPGLYDDIYMDLTFVDVFDREGLDAPDSSHAIAFATAEYALWHANQAARYNILNGIMPPQSGYWTQNPHSDDIDFQIEADFAGLMAPGMVNAASEICDRVGHIMNYGDGWYGGVFVAAMYSLAFVTDDIDFIVQEALEVIPAESEFYQCISDVISWHTKYPEDWKQNWWECQKKWSEDRGCPDGVFRPFNIDAKINAAYIVIGLLYGEGDFSRTLDISTRCGQDSDCNPASAGGILGVILGYDNIPDEWKSGLSKVEDIDFKYTDISLNDAYRMSTEQAIAMIKRNGGTQDKENLAFTIQKPEKVRLEQGFKGHYPSGYTDINKKLNSDSPRLDFEFFGNGFILKGRALKTSNELPDDEIIIQVFIDGELHEEAGLPTSFITRRHEICWAYELENGKHSVELKVDNPVKGYELEAQRVIFYGPEEVKHSY